MEDGGNPSIFIIGAMDVAIQCNSVADTEDDKPDVFYSPYSSLHLDQENKNLQTIENCVEQSNCVQKG